MHNEIKTIVTNLLRALTLVPVESANPPHYVCMRALFFAHIWVVLSVWVNMYEK